MGHTVVTIRASDADDPDSGSSLIEFTITAGDDEGIFTVETDGKGVGHLVVVKVPYLPQKHTQIMSYNNLFVFYIGMQLLIFSVNTFNVKKCVLFKMVGYCQIYNYMKRKTCKSSYLTTEVI